MTSPPADRAERLRPWAAAGGALLLLPVWWALFHHFVFDDAYISYRYASNWAAGLGPTFNPGLDPVEGFTNFAWVALAAAVEWATGLRPDVTMPWVGALCWLALAGGVAPALLARAAGEGGGAPSPASRFAVVLVPAAAAALALNPYLAFHAFHGLETAAQALALATAALLALRATEGGRARLLGLASFLAVTIRPDAVAFLGPLWTVVLVARRRRRDAGAPLLDAALFFALPVAVFVGLKWAYYGHPVPNSVLVKSEAGLEGARYVLRWLGMTSPLWGPLVVLAARAPRALLRDAAFWALAAPALTMSLAYARFNPTMGLGYRFLVPTLVPLTGALVRAAWLGRRHEAWALPGVLAALAACVGLFGARMAFQYDYLQDYFGAVDRVLVDSGRRLQAAAHLEPRPVVATGDVGAVPYYSGLPTLDLIGLTDEVVARDGLGEELLDRWRPDLLLLQDLYLLEEGAMQGTSIVVDGRARRLDDARYRALLARPGRARTGAGATWAVVRWDGFADFEHVRIQTFSGGDRYHWFVRSDHPHAAALRRLLREGGT